MEERTLNEIIAQDVLGCELDLTPAMDFTGSWDASIGLAKQLGVTISVKDLQTPEHLARVCLRWVNKNKKDPLRHQAVSAHVIEADGGTSCNVPALGYGEGYGSYQIDGGPVRRHSFGMGHSNNSAEIQIIVEALRDLAAAGNSKEKIVMIRSDSQIALKWVSHLGVPSKKSSSMFKEAIGFLRTEVARFASVRTEWRGRDHSVALFGH